MMKKTRLLKGAFLIMFALMVLAGKNINFSKVVGAENQFFTLYQFVGPLAGSFLGTTFGVISVLIAELASFVLMHKELTAINLLRLTPMLFAAYYFGNKNRLKTALIPLICMIAFIVHPVGRQAWPFTLYWLVPIIGRIMPNNNKLRVLLQSFGSTFTAHAVGSTLWLYTVPMTSAQWLALIPVVALERIIFGFGIAGSFYLTRFLLKKLAQKVSQAEQVLNVNKVIEAEVEAVEVKAK